MSSRDKENIRKERDIPTKAKKSPGNPNRFLILKILPFKGIHEESLLS